MRDPGLRLGADVGRIHARACTCTRSRAASSPGTTPCRVSSRHSAGGTCTLGRMHVAGVFLPGRGARGWRRGAGASAARDTGHGSNAAAGPIPQRDATMAGVRRRPAPARCTAQAGKAFRRLPERRHHARPRPGDTRGFRFDRAHQALHHHRHGDRPGQDLQRQRARHSSRGLDKAIAEQVGLTTFRMPYTPVTFGSFAGFARGDLFDPVRDHADPRLGRAPWARCSRMSANGGGRCISRAPAKRCTTPWRASAARCACACWHVRRLDAWQDRSGRP
jgi:hypothetical protein